MSNEPKTVGEALSQIMQKLKELTGKVDELAQELREMRVKIEPDIIPPTTTTTDWKYKYTNGDTAGKTNWITADNKTTAVKLNDKI